MLKALGRPFYIHIGTWRSPNASYPETLFIRIVPNAMIKPTQLTLKKELVSRIPLYFLGLRALRQKNTVFEIVVMCSSI